MEDSPQSAEGIPLPLATAGIGMIVAAVGPKNWSIGHGFVYGLLFGLLLIFLVAAIQRRSHHPKSGDFGDG